MIVPFKRIRTYLPLSGEMPQAYTPGALEDACPSLPAVLALLKDIDPIGRVGQYAAVHHIIRAMEAYVPLPGSHPTLGTVNTMESTCAISFSTYAAASVPPEPIAVFVERLAELHPWEHPMIEINDIALWMPNTK